ncbi:gliding motility protein GldL [Ancylomarina salipaludis]|uniref:Gliding motility protein GldL n=1 Tax=Ancylomarina salipaludis TaxID=2501299 RepID=A0A4Q1JLE2_9BACT|nr:gliding motility protein GldL [Ancylomarina salipaludis]RXQ92966.1 gliding motility protein GldL [Ancylomarina salipaludis]
MNITELVESPRWKRFMGYVYGWGASVVLLGALFKIQHWAHAGTLLTVGMLTEVIIFFFSAFEPPHEEPDWSLVYPELIGLDPRETSGGLKVEGLDELQSFLENVSIDSSKLTNLSRGLGKLTDAAERISDISEAAVATEGYIETLRNASKSVGTLSETYNSSSTEISESASELSKSYNQLASDISANGKIFSGRVQESGDQLLNTYEDFKASLNGNFSHISESGKNYAESMAKLNEKLSSLNSVFELQLKHSSEQIEEGRRVQENFNEIVQNLNVTLDNTKVYRQETEALNQRLSALNSVYGNMLSALDISKNKN